MQTYIGMSMLVIIDTHGYGKYIDGFPEKTRNK
jgi:hypothetical protein